MSSFLQKKHSKQVAVLSEKIFTQLKKIHHLGNTELEWLKNAALLHDIGWINGRNAHHKRSRNMIIKCPYLPFTKSQRLIIALISRYHRGSLPRDTHKYFRNLNPVLKNKVCWLAGILKISDGLDRTHLGTIKDIKCRITKNQIEVGLTPKIISAKDRITGLKKADILERYSGRKISILS